MKKNYIIACCTPWFWKLWSNKLSKMKGRFVLVRSQKEFLALNLQSIKPRYIFFTHWRHLVPRHIFETYECVCFHMTPLPYGRGGSPLQNMIIRDHKMTKVSAFRINSSIDGGDLYYQKNMPLHGRAEEIYMRASRIIKVLIRKMVTNEPLPKPQKGRATCFRRRTPKQSKITNRVKDIKSLFDFIRMLDAKGYPRAYLDAFGFRFIFQDPRRHAKTLESRVIIERLNK